MQWFYRLTDGTFTGDCYAGVELEANTPDGCGAVSGVTDWRTQRVDLVTGELVAYVPPQPPADAMRTWVWSGQARQWLPRPTRAALAADVRRERDQRLTACDWVLLRSLELGEPLPAEWAAYRAALRAVPQQPGFPDAVEWPVSP